MACSAILIAKIKESKVYDLIQTYKVPQLRNPIKHDNLKTHYLGCPYFISYDIPKANYFVLKDFDHENEFPETWEIFCYQNGVPFIFSISKMFRQIVFGNTNPRKFQKIQSEYVDDLITVVGPNIDPELSEPSFKSADELIQRYKNEPIQLQLNRTPKHKIFKLTPFEFEHIERDYYVKTIYNMDGYKQYRTLYGVPGSMFYMYFKQNVLGQELDDRDLLFWTEKRLAKWVI